MNRRFSAVKALVVVAACGGVPLVTSATCDPYYGTLDFFRDDDDGYFYDPGYYFEDVYYFDPYCDPFFCY